MTHLGEVAEWPIAPVLKTGDATPEEHTPPIVATHRDSVLPSYLPSEWKNDPNSGVVNGANLRRVIDVWATLPPAIQAAVMALVDAGK